MIVEHFGDPGQQLAGYRVVQAVGQGLGEDYRDDPRAAGAQGAGAGIRSLIAQALGLAEDTLAQARRELVRSVEGVGNAGGRDAEFAGQVLECDMPRGRCHSGVPCRMRWVPSIPARPGLAQSRPCRILRPALRSSAIFGTERPGRAMSAIRPAIGGRSDGDASCRQRHAARFPSAVDA